MKDKGYIYILKNPSMPNIYKIGLTRVSVEQRIATLRSTSVPFDFECLHSEAVDYALQVEAHIHKKLKSVRAAENREFFFFPTDEAALTKFKDCLASFNSRAYTDKELARLETVNNPAALSPSQLCKRAGLKGLTELSKISETSVQTLTNWHKNKPHLFDVVVIGAAYAKDPDAFCEKHDVDLIPEL